MTDLRTRVARKFNLPPSYVLIHRVSTAGIGVLCQLECEGPFRAEVVRWVPGYAEHGGDRPQTETRDPAQPGDPGSCDPEVIGWPSRG